MWCIGQLTPADRQRMYDLLDLDQLPYNPDEPVVCVDEKSKQLLAHTRTPIAHQPGAPGKEDYEYERFGTRNLFVAVEPLSGWRQVVVTQHRKKADFVKFIRQLLTGRYRQAQKIHLVLDNRWHPFCQVFCRCFRRQACCQAPESHRVSLYPGPRQLAEHGGNRDWDFR